MTDGARGAEPRPRHAEDDEAGEPRLSRKLEVLWQDREWERRREAEAEKAAAAKARRRGDLRATLGIMLTAFTVLYNYWGDLSRAVGRLLARLGGN